MKECKDIDPARTDRVSVWICRQRTITDISTDKGIDYKKQKYIRRYIDKFQILR